MNLIFKFLIKSQLFVSVCITALAAFVQNVLGVDLPIVLIITFLSTLAVYNLVVFQPNKNENWRIFISVCALIPVIGLSFNYLNIKSIILLSVLSPLSLSYSIPFTNKGLRWIPLLKIGLIGFIWACVLFILPLFNTENSWQLIQTNIFLFFGLFLFVLGITIPFDIRDLKWDNKNLKTIPQVFGLKKSKILSVVSLLLSFLFFYLHVALPSLFSIAFGITVLIAIVFSLWSTTNRNKWYFGFWLEGVSALPLIIYLLLK